MVQKWLLFSWALRIAGFCGVTVHQDFIRSKGLVIPVNLFVRLSTCFIPLFDAGFVARCKVKVEIHDENDNAPIFSQAKYSAVLIPGNGIKDSVINVSRNMCAVS